MSLIVEKTAFSASRTSCWPRKTTLSVIGECSTTSSDIVFMPPSMSCPSAARLIRAVVSHSSVSRSAIAMATASLVQECISPTCYRDRYAAGKPRPSFAAPRRSPEPGVRGSRHGATGGPIRLRDQAGRGALDPLLLDDLTGPDLSEPGAARGQAPRAGALRSSGPPAAQALHDHGRGRTGAAGVADGRRADPLRAARHRPREAVLRRCA